MKTIYAIQVTYWKKDNHGGWAITDVNVSQDGFNTADEACAWIAQHDDVTTFDNGWVGVQILDGSELIDAHKTIYKVKPITIREAQ